MCQATKCQVKPQNYFIEKTQPALSLSLKHMGSGQHSSIWYLKLTSAASKEVYTMWPVSLFQCSLLFCRSWGPPQNKFINSLIHFPGNCQSFHLSTLCSPFLKQLSPGTDQARNKRCDFFHWQNGKSAWFYLVLENTSKFLHWNTM